MTHADTVLDRLSKATPFAFGGIGFAAATSRGELDYDQILARPTAASDFEKLFQTGTPEAKCYALTALYTLNHDEFLRLATPLRKSDAKVSTMSGCVMAHHPISAVIAEIEAGIYSPKK